MIIDGFLAFLVRGQARRGRRVTVFRAVISARENTARQHSRQTTLSRPFERLISGKFFS